MAGLRGDAKQLRRRSDSRCSWRRIANHSRLSAAAASDSASCSIMSGKRGATWRREPTYPGEDRRSAADPDRWDDLGESKENAIDWFARARCSTTWRGGGNSSGPIALCHSTTFSNCPTHHCSRERFCAFTPLGELRNVKRETTSATARSSAAVSSAAVSLTRGASGLPRCRRIEIPTTRPPCWSARAAALRAPGTERHQGHR